MRADFLQLRYGRGQVIEPFLVRTYGEPQIRHLILVSPWMTHLRFRTGTTADLVKRVEREDIWITLITRPPDGGDEHLKFLEDFRTLMSAEIFYMTDLHAKYFICTTAKKTYALVGSANLYRWSSTTFDLGVIIEARGAGEEIISSLRELTMDLRNGPSTKRIKELRTRDFRHR